MRRESIAWYWGFYEGKKLALVFTSALLVLQPIALMAILYGIRSQFDSSIAEGRLAMLLPVSIGLILLYLFSGGLALYIRSRILRMTHEVIIELRREIATRLYAFSRQVYARFDRNRLQTLLVQDVIRVDIMTDAFAGQLIPGVVIVVTMTAFLVGINVSLFALLACLFPALVLLERFLRPMLRQLVQGHHRTYEDLQRKTLFGLEALDLTHARGVARLEVEEQVDATDRFRLVSTRLALFREAMSFAQDVFVLITSVVCLMLGAWFVVEEQMSLGELLAFYMAVLVMRPHLRTCWAALPGIAEGVESLNSIYRWVNQPDSPPRFGDGVIAFSGEVRFRKVNFSYSAKPLLRDIDLQLRPGETTTILGPNGAGKSTIAYLLLGFYQPQSGSILVDGLPLESLAISPFRQQLGVVPQHPLLFQGTILDNITYGITEYDEQAVKTACRLARADEFIRLLPEGYNSPVGDNGMLLSGGQRQRIVIARALLNRPSLLILDEPSTYIDLPTVGKIMANLRQPDYRPAILLITHDAALVDYGEHIYRLEDGILSRECGPIEESV